jgi:hypothetical protein
MTQGDYDYVQIWVILSSWLIGNAEILTELALLKYQKDILSVVLIHSNYGFELYFQTLLSILETISRVLDSVDI